MTAPFGPPGSPFGPPLPPGASITTFAPSGALEGSLDIERLVGEYVEGRTTLFLQGFSSEVLNEIQVGGQHSPGTPIDTGFARANWDAAVNGEPAGGTAGGDESPDPAAAEARVARAVLEVRMGDTLVVTNSAPYARKLELGHSGQAPQGMVGLTFAAAPQIAEEVAAAVRESGA